MPISQEALFKMALNLEDPWYIATIDFSAKGKQLDIHVDFKTGSKFPCAKCGKTNCSVHDTIERTWRHLNFFQFKTYIPHSALQLPKSSNSLNSDFEIKL